MSWQKLALKKLLTSGTLEFGLWALHHMIY